MTIVKIINGRFYINGIVSNQGNSLSEGRLVGISTDMCSFFDSDAGFDILKNKKDFLDNLSSWKNNNINLITAALQTPNPFGEYYKRAREQDKTRDFSHASSAIKSDGSLNFNYLANLENIIRTADTLGFVVLVNILNSSCENIFADEFAVINGIFNSVEWLAEKNFSNVIVNITDVSHTFYKSSVLNGDRFIGVFKSVKNKVKENLIIGAGIKSFVNINAKNITEYIRFSDFIPIYAKSNHDTKKMLETVYFFKQKIREAGSEVPVIMAKGDDLNEKYNIYGKNNLAEALENGVSWCYYDRDGFVILPVNWDKKSSSEKIKFFHAVENIENI